ncbi:MAG: hypothetical protein Q9226_000009 [Calogaya cf. arnoldii]
MSSPVPSALAGEFGRCQGRKDESDFDGVNRATKDAHWRFDMVKISGNGRIRSGPCGWVLRMWKVGMGQSKGNFERSKGRKSGRIVIDQRGSEG